MEKEFYVALCSFNDNLLREFLERVSWLSVREYFHRRPNIFFAVWSWYVTSKVKSTGRVFDVSILLEGIGNSRIPVGVRIF